MLATTANSMWYNVSRDVVTVGSKRLKEKMTGLPTPPHPGPILTSSPPHSFVQGNLPTETITGRETQLANRKHFRVARAYSLILPPRTWEFQQTWFSVGISMIRSVLAVLVHPSNLRGCKALESSKTRGETCRHPDIAASIQKHASVRLRCLWFVGIFVGRLSELMWHSLILQNEINRSWCSPSPSTFLSFRSSWRWDSLIEAIFSVVRASQMQPLFKPWRLIALKVWFVGIGLEV